MFLSQHPLRAGNLDAYLRLMRHDRPIGTWLLLWPTLVALCIAAEGMPSIKNLLIFGIGTYLMRSAGCVINDYFDRHIDTHVTRTRERPLANGDVSEQEALALFTLLIAAAFVLVLFTNTLTITLSFFAALLAASYPLMKRWLPVPQLVLGLAFSAGIPMAFAAERGTLTPLVWYLFGANIFWTIAYDTFYAMVDREDDLKIGVKSSAILFGRADLLAIGVLQTSALLLMAQVGNMASLGWPYYVGLIAIALLFVYHQYLARAREREPCFQAFLHNNWVGACWFLAVALSYAL